MEVIEPGVCYIKNEYLLQEAPRDPDNWDSKSNKRKKDDDAGGKSGRKRGQNKNRPIYKEERTEHLCHSMINGGTGDSAKCERENCRYVHCIEEYMKKKGEDLGEICYVYTTKGFCPRGVTCRFAKAHLDENGKNISNIDGIESAPSSINGITPALQIRLRKREYDFSRSSAIVAQCQNVTKPCGDESGVEAESADNIEQEKPAGACVDEISCGRDAKPRTKIDFRGKLLLSPLTTVGNLPFRRICKEFGADITCGEMACVVPIVKGLTQEWALTKRHESEDVFGVQLCGNNPLIITQAAQLVQETASVDFLDLNIGCPIDLIYQNGGGSALMRRTNVLKTTVRSCSALLDIPFTVKMRTGVYADKSVAHELVPLVEEWGASAVTLHGRSREQRYTKNANWEYIERCAGLAKSMPVIGNGDILSYEDFNERLELAPHVSSVMIGRGALIKPWIFKEIKEQKHWDPSSSERFQIMQKFVNYGLEHWGSDTKGVETTRRFLLEWQSFLYRYIPHELIVHPPQKINQRPQKFRGRDELETLMCSPNAADWVKLSEMMLGPVPMGYNFMPKHKANSY